MSSDRSRFGVTADQPIVVVGGGFGGLASSLVLAHAGYRVTLLESNASLGGKCRREVREGYICDSGPSVLTMPFVLEHLFESTGASLDSYLELERVEPGCRYFFPDGSTFDAYGGLDRFGEALAETFPAEREGWEHFRPYLESLWEVSREYFLFGPLDGKTLRRVRPRDVWEGRDLLRPGSLHRQVAKHFRDPRLIQLFDRFATYNGSDPYRTPSAFNVIAYVELAFGSWRVRGGMYRLVEGLERRARELGVEIRLSTPVDRVQFSGNGERAIGVVTRAGEEIRGAVVINQDAIAARTGPLLASHPWAARWRSRYARSEASSSGFYLHVGVKRTFPELHCHNIWFPAGDYRREFEELFQRPSPLSDPTVYLSKPGFGEGGFEPEGGESWFVLVNAPSLQKFRGWKEGDYADFLRGRLLALVPGLGDGDIAFVSGVGPKAFAERVGAWHGSLYGLSSNPLWSAFQRVPATDPVSGVFYAGGGAHPGGGVPLALLSGVMAAHAVQGKRPDLRAWAGEWKASG